MSIKADLFQAQPPRSGGTVKKAPSTRYTTRLTFKLLPESAGQEARDGYSMYLMLCGTSKSVEVEQWKLYIASYSSFIVPSIAPLLPRDLYQVSQFSPVELAALEVAYRGYRKDVEKSAEGATQAMKTAFLLAFRQTGFPEPDASLPWHEGFMEIEAKIVVCHYSIVLFLMSKRVTPGNPAPISVNRPKALRSKAHIEDICAFLDGDLRLSDSSHIPLNNAWAEAASLRSICVKEFSTYQEMETDITQDLIYTSMHLMRFGGMVHAKITYAFLRAHPWADEVPALKGAIALYRDSIVASAKYPVHLRPFIKLVYGDKVGLFQRNDLEVIVDCAVAVEKANNPTLEDFFVSDKYGAIVEAFLAEKQKRENIYHMELEKKAQAVGVGGDYDEEEEEEEAIEEE